jgi:hypothetical protein
MHIVLEAAEAKMAVAGAAPDRQQRLTDFKQRATLTRDDCLGGFEFDLRHRALMVPGNDRSRVLAGFAHHPAAL